MKNPYFYTAYLHNELICVGNTINDVDLGIATYLNHDSLAHYDEIAIERQTYAIHPRWFDDEYFEKKREDEHGTTTNNT